MNKPSKLKLHLLSRRMFLSIVLAKFCLAAGLVESLPLDSTLEITVYHYISIPRGLFDVK